jgi:hypothetical protein
VRKCAVAIQLRAGCWTHPALCDNERDELSMPSYSIRLCESCGKAFTRLTTSCRHGKGRFCGRSCRPGAGRDVPLEVRFWGYVQKGEDPNDCWLWIGPKHERGYGYFCSMRKTYRAHRFSWELHFPDQPIGDLEVCHNCPGGDRPECSNPAHLFLGSHTENMEDMVRKGRSLKGSACPNAKLTEAQVREMRGLHAAGHSMKGLARMFNVKPQTVKSVVSGATWRHVT